MGKGGANPYPGWWATSDEPVIKEPRAEREYPYNIETDEERRKRELDEFYRKKTWSQRRKEFEEDFKRRFFDGEFFAEDYEKQSTNFTNGEYESSNDIHPIFKIKRSSSKDDFKKQYKKLILEHHPDKGGDGSMFIKIQEAWENIKLKFGY
tara:strand:- start:194 stop:646 length:453 start_codon:yes stop_codon:yes gene_type:complete